MNHSMVLNGQLDETFAMLATRYASARQSGSVVDMLSTMIEMQMFQSQLQLLALADNRDLLALAGWQNIPGKPTQVSVPTTATLVVDLEHGEKTVVLLYIHDPTNASPVAFGGPGVTFNNGHIWPAGVILPAWSLTESLYAVAQTGAVTVSIWRKG